MNWGEAVTAMRNGDCVQRLCDQSNTLIGHSHGVPVYQGGQEPMRLAHAWTGEETPVMIFQGACSRCLFVPDSDHRNAKDWVVV